MATTKKTSAKNTSSKEHGSSLHYDKTALLADYTSTFRVVMIAVGLMVGLFVLYFFGMAAYLGGWSHTRHEPFVKQFGERIDIEYDGLKLPIHSNE